MKELLAGQLYEINYPSEGVDFWRRVRIVSDDGKVIWIKMADRVGNSFPVPRADLRPLQTFSGKVAS